MSRIFPDLPILFAFILLIAWALTFLKGKSANVLASPKVIYIFLILWTFVGFLFVLDNSMRYGCLGVSVSQPIGLGYSIIHLPTEGVEADNIIFIDYNNLAYSAISIILITAGFLFKGKKGVIILCVQIFYWLIKLLFIKGGYAVGIGGTPDFTVVFFDSLALILRLVFIYTRQDFVSFHKLYLIPISFIIMAIKLSYF